ncbi:MAG: hypothetical protein JWN48_5547 [Myxococcaceae bacterium]|nr:hypothetical protein [Myxococcaceae bacterium]
MFALVVGLLPAASRASAPGVHLRVGQLTIGGSELAAAAPLFKLAEPCLACAALTTARLTGGSSSSQPSMPVRVGSSPPSRPAPASLRAQQLSSAFYIGDTWRLRGGRELSLHLTPNEGHCAPLMRLTF